jgi:CpeT/CpcT family (DUF1001)
MKEVAAIVSVLLLAACATAPTPGPAAGPATAASPATAQGVATSDVDPLDAVRAQDGLERLVSYLIGRWDTVPQKEGFGDSTPMRMRVARLWPERADRYWLYLEYVNPADERQVLRQRILQFVREGSTIHALMYRLPGNPADYVGEWRKEHPFASVKPDSLREIQGCRSVWDRQFEIYFAGGTEGNACPGDRPEVQNEHWEYSLGPGSLRTWITGLDAKGRQVDGLSGPSEFRKTSSKLT